MLTSIEGIYENGHIAFDELPPTQTRSRVIVTFINEVIESDNYVIGLKGEKILKKPRLAGSLKGMFSMSEDFNAELDCFDEYI